MKIFFLSTLFILFCSFCHAQPSSTHVIKGLVKDSITKYPLGFVTLTVKESVAGKSHKTILSREDGSYEFLLPKGAGYLLSTSFVGYQTKLSILNLTGTKLIDTLNILLVPSANGLKEVKIIANKAFIHQQIDRISYNVQADPESKVLTLAEMLRKVPLISVDGEDNVELQGSKSYRIFINGKPSPLLTTNAKDILRTLPANTIQQIEVITTPPVKYDSEGLAGIINIITIAKKDDGYNGSVTGRYSYPQGPSISANSTIKNGKLGISLAGAYSLQAPVTIAAGNLRQAFEPFASKLQQTGSNESNGHTAFVSSELSYEADSLHLLTTTFNFNSTKFNQDLNRFTVFNQEKEQPQTYSLSNDGNNSLQGVDAGVNYQIGFKRYKNRLFTLSYLYSYFSNNQHSDVGYTHEVNYSHPNYNQTNNAGSHEQTFQLDYIQPAKSSIFEAGLKSIFRNYFSVFENAEFKNVVDNYVFDPNMTDDFNYHQNVYSAYTSYLLKLKNWSIKTGLRLEETRINAPLKSSESNLNTNYANFVPAVSIMHSISQHSNLVLGYTDRTSRPSIYQLNPFVDRSSPNFISYGNPSLRPVIRHLFELIYTQSDKVAFSTRLAYSFSNNTIESVTTLLSDTISQTTYLNIGKLKNASIYSSISYPITRNVALDLNGQLAYIKLFGLNNGMKLANHGYRSTFNAACTYRISPQWRMATNLNYNSPYILLQGKGTRYFGNSFTLTRYLLNDKFTVTALLNNPYKKFQTYTSSTLGDSFYQTSFTANYYRTFAFALNYKFGKLSSSVKKSSRSITNDDVKNEK